jgi:hypothetical protein
MKPQAPNKGKILVFETFLIFINSESLCIVVGRGGGGRRGGGRH